MSIDTSFQGAKWHSTNLNLDDDEVFNLAQKNNISIHLSKLLVNRKIKTISKFINSKLKEAMLAKDVLVRDTLRLITSEIKRFEVDNRSEVKDEDVISILKKMSKQRKDSIEQYSKGGRPDLEKIESDELKIIDEYLPVAVQGEELQAIIKEIIAEKGLEGMQGMGILMKELKNLHPNADMSQASNYAKELLS